MKPTRLAPTPRSALPSLPALRRGIIGLLVFLCAVSPPLALSSGPAFAEEALPGGLLHASTVELPPALLSVATRTDTTGAATALPLLSMQGAAPRDDNPWALRKWLPLIAVIALAAGLSFGIDSPDEPRWTAENSFDDSARDSLRNDSKSGRDTADTLSTAFLAVNGVLLAGDWYLERDLYSPLDSFRVDATWVFGSQLVNTGTKLAAARERPFVQDCRSGALISSDCNDDDRFESFYSGHTGLSSTLAGLLCARRLHRPDRDAADWLLCGGASSLALATGFMRVNSDKHWMSDVMVGWGTGIVFGYVLPSVFHYGKPESQLARRPKATHMVTPIAGTSLWGLRYDVSF